ncbi:aspartyl protease family protein [Pedobacter sp. MC2016-24]|uniref:aspartyl protease family protein n=1 Tax=Pedobacter sp. MC2016-24 TaxID=2780090 RepID=UPI001880480C|nr:aspartyl protease family protein [Pedobacter sp. MC2016-24]MBE9599334.1 aspartyl protease family protein [Pedobacter sp. MC2016-24]
MKKLIFVAALFLFQYTAVWSKEQPMVQIEYVLKQLGEKLQKGEYKSLKVLLSSQFRVGKYPADQTDKVVPQLLSQAKFEDVKFADIEQKNGKVYASIKLTMAGGNALVGKVKLNEYLEIERLGIFDQLLENPDPVAYELAKPTSAIHVTITRSAGMMFIKVKVNGSRDLNFLFDTGAAITVVDTKTAAELGLKTETDKLKVGSSSGIGSFQTFIDPVFTVGGVNVKAVNGITSDMSGFTRIFGLPVAGIIGQDLLRDLLVEVDLDQNQLNIYNGGNLDWKPGQSAQFKMRFSSGTPKIKLNIFTEGESHIGEYLFDTGAGAGLAVNGFYNFKYKIKDGLQQVMSSKSLDLAGHQSESMTGKIKGVKLGGYTLNNPQASVSAEPESQLTAQREAGLLGMGILDRFNMLFNNQQSVVSMSPNGTFNDPFVPVYQLGLGLSWLGAEQFVVSNLNTMGKAYLAGLRNDDQILKVNGNAPAVLNDIVKELKTLNKADLKLEVKRGQTVQIITLKKLSV